VFAAQTDIFAEILQNASAEFISAALEMSCAL